MELVRIAGRYRLKGRLTSGPSHEIYLAHDVLLEENVVIKLEPVEGKNHTLDHEYHVYSRLSGGTGIPHVCWFGIEAGFYAMVVKYLGPFLEDLFVCCHFKFTVKTVLLLAGQVLRCLQHIHSRNFIHCDLKPCNIVMGVGEQANLVHLIDFGLSKEFRDPKTHVHIPYKKDLGLAGTAVFASINSHLGLELGRRDDLESLAYILFYFLWGFLPWQGLGKNDMLASKRTISAYNLFHELRTEFHAFLEHCRSLPFDGKPNYNHFLSLFDNLLLTEVLQSEMAFDWDVAGGKVKRWGRRKSGILKHERSPSVKRRTG
ncbi:Protein kinase-like domain containing protein [Russula decolorans]